MFQIFGNLDITFASIFFNPRGTGWYIWIRGGDGVSEVYREEGRGVGDQTVRGSPLPVWIVGDFVGSWLQRKILMDKKHVLLIKKSHMILWSCTSHFIASLLENAAAESWNAAKPFKMWEQIREKLPCLETAFSYESLPMTAWAGGERGVCQIWFLFYQFWTLKPDFWPIPRLFSENWLLTQMLNVDSWDFS